MLRNLALRFDSICHPRMTLAGTYLVALVLAFSSLWAAPTMSILPAAPGLVEGSSDSSAALSSLGGRERSEHIAGLGVDRWHTAGFQGRGMKVAILDSGFRGYRDQLGKALPTKVLTHSFRDDGNLEAKNSQHGILCGEVVHALAPEAEILFANWEAEKPDRFLEAVRWAREEGARIVSCSVIMPSWSDGEGGGTVHETLSRLLGKGDGAGDVLCFACAGNTARRHWSGVFQAAKTTPYHAWKPGAIDNVLTPWGDERVSIELYSAADASFELIAYDLTTGAEVGKAATSADHSDRHIAVVRFLPQSEHRYSVRVRLVKGVPSFFHVVALSCSWLEHASARGSIPFPGDGASVLTVGAVSLEGERQSYSSCGPNSTVPKPDFVAPVPFPSSWRKQTFGGTSAATPEAAGLTAIFWARHPNWTAEQVRAALRKSARDLGPPGHDFETGYGFISLPRE